MGGIGISFLENGGVKREGGEEMMMISYVMYIFVSLSLFLCVFAFCFLYIDVTLMW